MDKSVSTITLTEHALIANATLGLISDRQKNECKHTQLKSFKFSDGQTIRMCRSCTKFDQHRRAVLAGTKWKVKGEKFVTTFSEKPVLTLHGGFND
jgi:hypothetical protein